MNTDHEDKLDDQTFAQQATPLTITPEALERREQIARIIDPSSWRVFDEQLRLVKRIPNAGYDPDNFKDRKSLAIADAILATLEATQAENLRLREAATRLSTAASNVVIGIQVHNRLSPDAPARRDDIAGPVIDELHLAAHAARQALSTSGEAS